MGVKEGVELDGRGGGEDLGRDKGGETMIRLYYVKRYFPLKRMWSWVQINNNI